MLMRSLVLPLALVATLLSVGCAPVTYPPSEPALRDAQLVTRVKTTILNAPQIDATRIEVRAVEGAVTLDGAVVSDEHARLAVDLVRQVPGVTDVESRLIVKEKPAATSQARRRPTARF